MSGTTPYSAAGSLIGYIYQCRVGLLEALRRARNGEDFSFSLETLDDVVFESNASPKELLQVKHHINKRASLTDLSVDLWKTIGIWLDLQQGGSIPADSIRILLTTAMSAEGSAAGHLRFNEERSPSMAAELLVHAARSTSNDSITTQCQAFLALKDSDKVAFLETIFISDGQPAIQNLDSHLQNAIRFICPKEKESVFLDYLEGWWFKRCISALSINDQQNILSEEITAQMDDLREQFKADNLPIAEDLISAEKSPDLFADYRFVRQLELINITNSKRIAIAVNNYFRAFEQRSRWLRENLVISGDLDSYDKVLREEWEIRFEAMRDEIGDGATETRKSELARQLYNWAEQEADTPIRKDCSQAFIVRGSYHMLADRGDEPMVGWHPDFKNRLQAALKHTEETE